MNICNITHHIRKAAFSCVMCCPRKISAKWVNKLDSIKNDWCLTWNSYLQNTPFVAQQSWSSWRRTHWATLAWCCIRILCCLTHSHKMLICCSPLFLLFFFSLIPGKMFFPEVHSAGTYVSKISSPPMFAGIKNKRKEQTEREVSPMLPRSGLGHDMLWE